MGRALRFLKHQCAPISPHPRRLRTTCRKISPTLFRFGRNSWSGAFVVSTCCGNSLYSPLFLLSTVYFKQSGPDKWGTTLSQRRHRADCLENHEASNLSRAHRNWIVCNVVLIFVSGRFPAPLHHGNTNRAARTFVLPGTTSIRCAFRCEVN